MTLSTARASLRYKEIGVRKVTGAKRKTLITQFLSESLVQIIYFSGTCFSSDGTYAASVQPSYGNCYNIKYELDIIFYILFGIIGIGCLAGAYPAFYLSSVNPLLAFTGGRKTGKKEGLSKDWFASSFS